MNQYYVYVMSNVSKTLYIGVTNNLERRVWEHKLKQTQGFTRRYNCTLLVYFEETSDIEAAIRREKQLKGWKRERKITLIEGINPHWIDLSAPHTMSIT